MIELFFHPAVPHVTGFVAFILMVLSLQSNVRKNILMLMNSGLVFQALHFLLLTAYTGAALIIATIVRNLFFAQKEKYPWARHQSMLYLWIGVYIILALFFWEGGKSVFVLAGTVIGTISFWMDRPSHIRYVLIISASAWIPYAFAVQSFSTIALQLAILASVFIAMYRYNDIPNLRGTWIKRHRGVE